MRRVRQSAVVLLAVAAGNVPAPAAEVPAGSWTGNAGVVSDYVFRGLDQTNRQPALQAGLEYDHASGAYLGGWGSNVSWLSDASTAARPVSSSLELDLYAGWRGGLGGDWSWDAGVYRYQYPGSYAAGLTRPHTTEGYAAIAWRGLTLKYSHAFTDLFGWSGSRHSGYLDLAWNHPLAPGWLLGVHVGRQRVAHVHGASYSDWRIGVTRSFANGWSVALGCNGSDADRTLYTNAQGRYLGRTTVVLGLARSF